MTINGGKILFGDNGAAFPTTGTDSNLLSQDRDIVLASGTALGKTANDLELGTLALSGAGTHTLELGPTSTMTFADSSAKAWSGSLVIKGFRARAVRFGTNSAALSPEQQRLIKAEDGRCLHLLADGYLAPYGSRITIR